MTGPTFAPKPDETGYCSRCDCSRESHGARLLCEDAEARYRGESSPRMETGRHASFCMNCCQALHPVMLTTYCIPGQRCDHCGRVGDLALVFIRNGQ